MIGKLTEDDEYLRRAVWSLHSRGMTVTEIADRLHMSGDEVRALIAAIWANDNDMSPNL